MIFIEYLCGKYCVEIFICVSLSKVYDNCKVYIFLLGLFSRKGNGGLGWVVIWFE